MRYILQSPGRTEQTSKKKGYKRTLTYMPGQHGRIGEDIYINASFVEGQEVYEDKEKALERIYEGLNTYKMHTTKEDFIKRFKDSPL